MGIDLSKVNEKFKACLPKDIGAARQLGAKKPEQDRRGERQDSQLEGGQERGGFRIQLIQLRRRLLDGHDNMRASLKPAVDRITHRLGFASDSDPGLTWEYHQIRTEGEERLLVVIEPYTD